MISLDNNKRICSCDDLEGIVKTFDDNHATTKTMSAATKRTKPNKQIEHGVNGKRQYLIRFCNKKTYVINENEGIVDPSSFLLEKISLLTGWPTNRLYVASNTDTATLSKTQYFININIKSCILGGKGGFGTLLKGQSKQAGARLTTDFGACRDLQGRRLRHVNDEIKLRKFREIQAAKDAGLDVNEINHLQTMSGIPNWYLMIPNWSQDSINNKSTKKIYRQWEKQIKQFQKDEDDRKRAKIEKEQSYQRSVDNYARVATSIIEEQNSSNNIYNAIQQGLNNVKSQRNQREKEKKIQRQQYEQKHNVSSDKKIAAVVATVSSSTTMTEVASSNDNSNKDILSEQQTIVTETKKKRKLNDDDEGDYLHYVEANNRRKGYVKNDENSTNEDNGDDEPELLCTLSGDCVVINVDENGKEEDETVEDNSGILQIQSKSDFSTTVLMLGTNYLEEKGDDILQEQDKERRSSTTTTTRTIYYEIQIVTGGISQIGWASILDENFKPNNDTGDGVGDDFGGSYGYDGLRKLKFYNQTERPYPTMTAPTSNTDATEKEEEKRDSLSSGWKPNDVIGCLYTIYEGNDDDDDDNNNNNKKNKRKNNVRYTKNGIDLGIAFEIDTEQQQEEGKEGGKAKFLIPAFSCNENEILQLHMYKKNMKYFPTTTSSNNDDNKTVTKGAMTTTVIPVGDLLVPPVSTPKTASIKSTDNKKQTANAKETKELNQDSSKLPAATKSSSIQKGFIDSKTTTTTKPEIQQQQKEEETSSGESKKNSKKKNGSSSRNSSVVVPVEKINLDEYNTIEEIENLGLERLKGALIAEQCKCGGTLNERAKRLFSLKGLHRKDYPMKVRSKNFII